MTINDIQNDLIDEFNDIDDWMDRYAYIIDMGNALDPMPEEYKTPQFLIEGCQSRAWLHAELDPDGNVVFKADSDAIIVKGIISMLLRVLSGQTVGNSRHRPLLHRQNRPGGESFTDSQQRPGRARQADEAVCPGLQGKTRSGRQTGMTRHRKK